MINPNEYWNTLNVFPGVQQAVKMATVLMGSYVAADVGIQAFFKGNKIATGEIAKNLNEYQGKDGFMLSKKHQLSYRYSCPGVVVVGPPDSAKTASFAYPHLLKKVFPKKTSIVVHDGKGNLSKHTMPYQCSIGRTCIVFSPLEGIGHYNPLEFCDNFSQVRELASNLLTNGTLAARLKAGGSLSGNDATWITMTTPYLTASLLMHKDLGEPYNNISTAIKFLINTPEEDKEDLGIETIDMIFKECDNELVQEQYNAFLMSKESGGTTGSIKGTLSSNLALFLDPTIAEATSKSDFTPYMLRDQKTTLYVKYHPKDSLYLAPFMSVFYSQLIDKDLEYQPPDSNDIVWLLDEFQNLGKINSFQSAVNTSKEAGYAFMIFLQSVSALYDIYGRSATDSILNALQIKCILSNISETNTMQYVSTLCGEEEITIKYEKGSHKTKKNLFEKSEVRRIASDKVLIVAKNVNPILVDKIYYYNDPKMIYNQYFQGV